MFNAQSIVVLRERLKVSSVCYEVITFSILHNILPGPLPGLALKAVKCSRKMELAFSVVLGDFPHSQHKLLECLALHRISPTVEGYSIQFKVAVLTYKVLHGCALSYLGPFVRVADLPSRRALRSTNTSRHSPTGPPLATEPFLLLVPKSGTVCHRRSHQRHHWTPFASV